MLHASLFAIGITVACPHLQSASIKKQSTVIANTVGDDIEGGMMMIATAAIESCFRPDVERCECKENECDKGAAISSFQLHYYWWGHYTRDTICQDYRIATRLAYKALFFLRKTTNAKEALRLYVGRSASYDDPRIKPRIILFDRLVNDVWHGGII